MQLRKALIGAGLCLAALVAFAFLANITSRTLPRHDAPGEVSGTVNSRYARLIAGSLTLQGSVIDMGHATAGTMTIRTGTNVTTTSVTLPNYSVRVQASSPDDMVSIEIVTPGYKYASILGSFRKLVAHAGADARLSVAELDRVRLSPLSTALHFFLKRDLGNRMPVSDIEHEDMIRSLLTSDIALAATVLDGFDNGTRTLPAGYANGYALLEDRAAYSQYLDGYTSGLFAYLNNAPSIPLQSTDVGQGLLLAGPIFRSDAVMAGPAVQILTATPSGYDMHAGTSRRNASFTSQLVAGDLVLVPQNEVYTEHYPYKIVDPGQVNPQVLERRTLMSSTLRRYFVGDRYSLWMEVKQEMLTYPEFPAHPPEYEIGNNALWVASELDTSPYSGSGELVGDRTLPLFCKQGSPATLASCEYALHKVFANGTGRTENVGPKVDASMQPVGALGGGNFTWNTATLSAFQMSYPGAVVTYWRVAGGDSASDLLAYVASAQDGGDTLTVAGSTPMLYVDGSAGFDELSADGTWRYATFDQFRSAYAYSELDFPFTDTFVRNPDGTGLQMERIQVPEFSDYDVNYRTGWQVLDGRLYETRYRANVYTGIPDTLYFSSCAQAFALGATQCAPLRVRNFRPLARVGNRLYGIEDLYVRSGNTSTNYAAPYTFDRFSRATFHEKQTSPAPGVVKRGPTIGR